MGPGGPGGPCEGKGRVSKAGTAQKGGGGHGGGTRATHVLALVALAALLSWFAHLPLREDAEGSAPTGGRGDIGGGDRVAPHLVTVLAGTTGGASGAGETHGALNAVAASGTHGTFLSLEEGGGREKEGEGRGDIWGHLAVPPGTHGDTFLSSGARWSLWPRSPGGANGATLSRSSSFPWGALGGRKGWG